MASLYIHIPFCQSRCIYCDFYSTTHLSQQEAYIECLIQELEERREEWPSGARSLSLYIGGGTPSTLSPTLLQRLMEKVTYLYPLEEGAEITIEANPDDVTEEWVDALKATAINRISMGVQTFDDTILHTLQRRHNAQQAKRAVKLLQEAGYTNISIDLIYGLPGQTWKLWQKDVEEALQLHVPHLSAYNLMYEEGTVLTRLLEQGLITEMDENLAWRCYEYLCSRLEEEGYTHYEISNFAQKGKHSQHNSSYWSGELYLGFGAGAHSYDGKRTRRANKDSLETYLKIKDGDATYYETEHLSPTDLYNEYIMTRLRTSHGLNSEEMVQRFGINWYNDCQQMIQPHLQQGNLVQEGSLIRLTQKGIFVSNDVMSDLFR